MIQELLLAAGRGETETVVDLLRRGADVNGTNQVGTTALTMAIRGDHVETVRVLLDRGADPNSSDFRGCTPTTEAVEWTQRWRVPTPDTRLLDMLKQAGGRFGLREAVLMSEVELARRICDADPTIKVSGDAHFSWHDTYLMVAARWGTPQIVRFLLDRGADIEGTDDLGATALMRAARAGNLEVVTLLLDRGADIDHDDWSDQTPLSEAAIQGHHAIVALLLSRDAARGLLDAVALDDAILVEELLRAGANPNNVYYGYGRPIANAVKRGNARIVRLLLDHGATLYDRSSDRRPPLDEAMERGFDEIARILIDRGASPNV